MMDTVTSMTSTSVIGVYGKSTYTSIREEVVLVVFDWLCNVSDSGELLKWT